MRIGPAGEDRLTAFVPPHAHDTRVLQGVAGEGVAVDADGNIYAAEGPGSRPVAVGLEMEAAHFLRVTAPKCVSPNRARSSEWILSIATGESHRPRLHKTRQRSRPPHLMYD